MYDLTLNAKNLTNSLLLIFWGSVIVLTIAILISYRNVDVNAGASIGSKADKKKFKSQ